MTQPSERLMKERLNTMLVGKFEERLPTRRRLQQRFEEQRFFLRRNCGTSGQQDRPFAIRGAKRLFRGDDEVSKPAHAV